ncbi:hypothetical protein BASA61_006439 [Batrachochytrium salamandrivorans]|nr:hypothetical protein BASA60_009318 [Batrachochytrium salamandrivorans]KAH6567541.1 hypothetical protein BASA62_006012 [Batrachochytrium salamandrivorans]KAH6586763.1 hypothetical protein BASA61_006439 [Batrachochytrium salamandrivorans]
MSYLGRQQHQQCHHRQDPSVSNAPNAVTMVSGNASAGAPTPILTPIPAGASDPASTAATATLISNDYNYCPPDILIHLIVSMLSKLVTHNDTIPVTDQSLTRFHSRSPPAITIRDYVVRIVRYANLEKAVLLILLIYIDRVCAKHESFTMSSLTAHRFIIAAASVASKSISDLYCTNGYYAKVGGITLQEMNILELEMCKMMDWEMSCQESLLQTYFYNLAKSSDLSLQFISIPQAVPVTNPPPIVSSPSVLAYPTATTELWADARPSYTGVSTTDHTQYVADECPDTPSSLPN